MKYLIFLLIPLAFLSFADKDSTELRAGDEAPNFELKNVDGKMVSLADFEDEKGIILIFTCNHCPYAKLYEERIIKLDKKYAKRGWPVVAINPNDPDVVEEDSYENMKVRAEEKGFSFPYLFDAKQEVYPQYGASRTPHVFLLQNNNGNFTVRYVGAIDDNTKNANKVEHPYVEEAIKALEKGETPEVEYTKAIGCGIKSKS